jgi:DNA-binding CsgD family transcriptional regulator
MARNVDRKTATGLQRLTPREQELARLLAQGMSYAEIAETLRLTRKTARAYADRIRVKANVSGRAGIVGLVT